MEIQRIEEIVDNTTIANHVIGNTDDSIAEADFDEIMLADLVSPFETEAGPEIFKRVRFISRWEYRDESRGRLLYKTDQYYWWTADCFEADAAKKAVVRCLVRTLSNDLLRSYKTWDTEIGINLFFVGQSVQDSRPVLLIFSMEKAKRKEAWRYCKSIDWVKAHPSLVLLTACNPIFYDFVKTAYAWECRYSWRRR